METFIPKSKASSWSTKSLRNFFLGMVTGFLCSVVFVSYMKMETAMHLYPQAVYVNRTQLNYTDQSVVPTTVVDPHVIFDQKVAHTEQPRSISFNDTHVHNDNDEVARDLKKKVKILIWVMTAPENLNKKAIHVKKTWGKRCDLLLFFSSFQNDSFPVIRLNVSEGRDHLTAKTMQAFQYIYEHHFKDADWFMKADDDTYVIVENLRYFLSKHDPNQPIFFGHHFKTIVKQGYFSGGAGYVLSKEALKRFATIGKNSTFCRKDGGAEDAEMGHCMEKLGVKTGNSTDKLGRSRFHCFDPETHVHGGYPDWYLSYDANGAKKGIDNISDYAITFHYVSPEKMYDLDFYIYHLRPYGIQSGNQDLNQ
ncbi:hypothetical protein ACJMK2_023280 [Sinanodonta woodiana]|uniref:Glycoprotein-N-acetylgalactosamine 3-beta-galactosyltransferase 1 n=1 Tax=Sinanodonta woodiana TaxID=1069815 RepID=A0ABD3T3P9_SINWO